MNNKIIVAIIILLSLGIFIWLVDYGWTHRYGSPETYQVIEPQGLVVNYIAQKLTLEPDDITAAMWQSAPGIEVELKHQISEKPWPRGLTANVKVQAFHDGKDVYFKMTWEDDHADTAVAIDKFADGCAVAIPIDAAAPPRSIMMGFSSPVNIWHWQAHKDIEYWQGKQDIPGVVPDYTYPFDEQEVLAVSVPQLESAVTDLLALRAGSLTRKERQIVQGRGRWADGNWSVVLKRSLKTDDSQRDSQFAPGQHLASFAVWDGDQTDRGSRKSISEWVNLQIAPPGAQKSAKKETSAETTRAESTRTNKDSWLSKFLPFSLVRPAHGATLENQPAQTEQVAKEPTLINITAQRFQYTPNRIRVRKGERITIRMESLDVTHGLYVDGYGIDIKARPGLIGMATFVADKTGRFSFRCSETCGEFHPYMIGFLEVTPNTRFNLFVWAIGITFALILVTVLRRDSREKGVEGYAGTEQ